MKKILSFLAALAVLAIFSLKASSPVAASDDPVMCTMQYAPVCAMVEVQCVRAPCNPVKQTFGNSCMAAAANATVVSQGECDTAPTGKKSPQKALRSGTWVLDTFNGKTVTQTGTITFERGKFHAKLCNVMNGRFWTTQSVMVFKNTMSTMMYCEGDIMNVENALGGMTRGSYMVGDTNLTITTRKGDIITWIKK